MKNKKTKSSVSLTAALSLFLFAELSAIEEFNLEEYRQQHYSETHFQHFGVEEDGTDYYYRVQHPEGEYVYFGPNEVFFDFKGPLRAETEKLNDKTLIYNRGQEVKYVEKFWRINDRLEWPFLTEGHENMHADFFIEAEVGDAGTTYSIQIDDGQAFEIVLSEEMINNGYFSLDFPGLEDRFHTLGMTLTASDGKNSVKHMGIRLKPNTNAKVYPVRELAGAGGCWSK